MSKILLVDDDLQSLESTRKILEFEGFQVETACDGKQALNKIRPYLEGGKSEFHLVISDVCMPHLGGIEFLKTISLSRNPIPLVLMTAYGSIQDAVSSMKLGAVDFLTKPFKKRELLSSIEIALKKNIRNNVHSVSSQRDLNSKNLSPLIGSSAQIQKLKGILNLVAPTEATVLVTGESGTGKDLVAQWIHHLSTRAHLSFMALNCACVPEGLIESELFGFEKGAFTGATQTKQGLMEVANHGTLFLDEIGDMPLCVQAKLLRCLQDGEVRRLGSTFSRKVDVRIIAATHRDLNKKVQEGLFRSDLLYRLQVVEIQVPNLSERRDDIPELVYFFLDYYSKKNNKTVNQVHQTVFNILMNYSWPGNIRELMNVIERGVIFSKRGVIEYEDLPLYLKKDQSLESKIYSHISIPLGSALKDVQELLIRKTLEATAGDRVMTARLLGIHSKTITRRLDKKQRV